MRAARLALSLTVAASLAATAGVGQAATKKKPAPKPKPVCNLLRDDPADSGLIGLDADDNQEIVGGDLASDAKSITAVLKLAKAPSIDPLSPGGLQFYVRFNVPGATDPVYLGAATDPTGALSYFAGTVTTDGTTINYNSSEVPVRGALSGTSLVMTASLSDFATLATVKKGAAITGLAGETFGVVNLVATGLLTPIGSDTAEDSSTYVAGTPSCVKPVA